MTRNGINQRFLKAYFSLALITGAIILFTYFSWDGIHDYQLFAVAGLFGSLVSILLKPPKPATYGKTVYYYFSFVARPGAGVAASLILYGLLASGLITVSKITDFFTDAKPLDEHGKAVLISLGILTGFSERAIYYFHDLYEKLFIGKKGYAGKKDEE
ncbi:MAG: hypothetical protein HY894_06865 [Deltaproteobacteria bacterium]|nr:hypothetical protein [Deltaproteobacteria bacterium]